MAQIVNRALRLAPNLQEVGKSALGCAPPFSDRRTTALSLVIGSYLERDVGSFLDDALPNGLFADTIGLPSESSLNHEQQ